jgi:alpha-glucosidase (family GH31 glycosyl hydrolase)
MPLYVRSGAVIPFGPVKQYTEEKAEEPITLVVYPGSDGEFTLYEDDGRTFDFRRGEWRGTRLTWDDKLRQLSLAPAKGSKLSDRRSFEIRLAAESRTRRISFAGRTTSIRL